MRGARFDKTVSIGDVLQILTILGALALGFGSIRERLAVLEFKVDTLWQRSNNATTVSTSGR